MPTMKTGNGATIGFTGAFTTALTELRSISGFERTLEALDDSVLATTYHKAYCPSDLVGLSPVTIVTKTQIDYFATGDPFAAYQNIFLGYNGTNTPVTCTVTMPKTTSTASVQAKVVFTGFVTRIKLGDLENGVINESEIEIQPDGATIAIVEEDP